ncbi:hypothetical protein K435DRAFT_93322 [Dendrothele bispora CBS 962.96]|uniref:Uncharacterized protein n=1 Tax=Dendrothele bispora (strain CBS 962.96) TaxID=1314807 RepID=A0A4S8MRN5_DENBC|nr:hypothetical protein K435DRAFT_93322 [Dendrothele bispora CBS 962.96]
MVTNRQAKMKQQWAELRSQNGDLSSSSPTSPMMNPTLPRPTLRTEPLMGEIDAGSEAVIIPDGSSPLSHLPDSAGGDTNTNTQTSLPTPADSNGNTLPAALDPEIQRRLNEMSQRIEELEVEKEELTRELKDAVPPPGYAE